MSLSTILSENRQYWTGRSAGYSKINRTELSTEQREKWKFCLKNEIMDHFPNRAHEELYVLDIGTGPGFFAILLSEMGFCVTAVDLTPAMLDEARRNAGRLAEKIRFLEMNAEQLDFPDDSFDVIVSRNLTWNLPHPEKSYAEWSRVLRPGGLLLNFDANWYSYLFDSESLSAYKTDRINAAAEGIHDANIGANFDIMEDIARRIPLSRIRRPGWDLDILGQLGLRAEADETFWERVWSREEKINFSSTPMFIVRAGA